MLTLLNIAEGNGEQSSNYSSAPRWLTFVDVFRDPILCRDILRGIGLQAVYVGVLLVAAWSNFTTKDVSG